MLFLRFPKDSPQKKKRVTAFKIHNKVEPKIYKKTTTCSDHFESQYLNCSTNEAIKLCGDAVPTIIPTNYTR